MTPWIPKKKDWLPVGEDQRPPERPKKWYSLAEVARLLSVDKRTVKKWLSFEEGDGGIIPPGEWTKLANGFIRISERAVLKLQSAGM